MAEEAPPRTQGEVDIQLLKDEGGGLVMEEGIATISFYKGDFKRASEALRAQFALVVGSNPWLAGRLVKTKAGVTLRHPASPSAADVDSLYTATSAEDAGAFKLKPTETYPKICTDMYASKKVIVGNGFAILGKDKPLTLLTLSEFKAGEEFALIFSMSHVIGDGRTYYEVYKMLQPGAAVRALDPSRVLTFSETVRDQCGRKELEWADSTGAICLYACAMMCAVLGFGKKPTCVAFHVDPERLAAAKAAGATDGKVPYVTTNDVLTSGFFTACDARIGMMGMDMRERLGGIGKDLAGNYVTALTMDPKTFGSPAALRQMLSTMPFQTTVDPLPTFWGWCCGRDSANHAHATNWSSFAGGLVQPEGCELTLHLPVLNPAACVYDLMVPFASGVGKVGVLCWTVSSTEEALRKALPVGDVVSRELFP